MSEPIVTLIVVPRERFSVAVQSLENLYQNTDSPFSLVYVDGGSPRKVRDRLAEESRRRGFDLIRTEHYLTPNQARNLGLAHATTPYVVFLDNDVLVEPGWLSALVACAEETGAAAVGPLYLEGRPDDRIIHMAGGLAHISEEGGRRIVCFDDFLEGRCVDDLPTPLVRQPTELLEFHCMLVRRDALARIGGFDEAFLNTREQVDFCLTLGAAGESVYIEPAARVTYMKIKTHIALSDLRYFTLRWSEAWTRATLEHYHRKWNLQMDETDLAVTWTKKQRYRFLEPLLTKTLTLMFHMIGRRRTRRLAQLLVFPIEGLLNRLLVRDPLNRSAPR